MTNDTQWTESASNATSVQGVLPTADPVTDRLPRIFRIQSITRLPADGRHVMNRAVLFHERASLSVEWASRHVDVRTPMARYSRTAESGSEHSECGRPPFRPERSHRAARPAPQWLRALPPAPEGFPLRAGPVRLTRDQAGIEKRIRP